MRTLTTHRGASSSPLRFRGLSDRECDDPLDDGLYQPVGYKARNAPPYDGKIDVPEVRKFENGDACDLIEPVEWLWYYAWRCRIPSLPEDTCLFYWKKHMRDDAAFTNKNGTTTKRSWVLGTNTTKGPMRSEGVDTPGANFYLAVDGKTVTKNGRPCVAVWCLDYHWIKTLSISDAKQLGTKLPDWLLHIARIVHPDGSVTNFDYDFRVPSMTSDPDEQTAVIDSFHVRRNYMRKSRLLQV